MPNIELYLIILVICLILSAFFSGSETAFISVQRIKLEHLVSNRVKGARQVASMLERPEKFLSNVLLGNTLVNTAAAAIATALAVSFWGEHGVLFATIGITVILLIFCETSPKTIASQHAERLSILFARPLQFFSWLFTPFVFILSWIALAFTKTSSSPGCLPPSSSSSAGSPSPSPKPSAAPRSPAPSPALRKSVP